MIGIQIEGKMKKMISKRTCWWGSWGKKFLEKLWKMWGKFKIRRQKLVTALLGIEMKKKHKYSLWKKLICLGLLILEINSIVIYEFWYDCLKPISFILYIKTEDTHVDIAKDVETRFDT